MKVNQDEKDFHAVASYSQYTGIGRKNQFTEFRFGKNGEIWTGKDDDILCKTQYIEQILLKYKIISIFCICATCYRCTVKRINKDG